MKLLYYKPIVLLSSCRVAIGLEEDREVGTTSPAGLSVAYRNNFPQITYNTYHRYLPRFGIVARFRSVWR